MRIKPLKLNFWFEANFKLWNNLMVNLEVKIVIVFDNQFDFDLKLLKSS